MPGSIFNPIFYSFKNHTLEFLKGRKRLQITLVSKVPRLYEQQFCHIRAANLPIVSQSHVAHGTWSHWTRSNTYVQFQKELLEEELDGFLFE